MTKEAELLAALMPSHPDLASVIDAMRVKYGLAEITPDDDPVEELYIGDEFISLEEFREEIKRRLLENLNFLPPETVKMYLSGKAMIEAKEIVGIDAYPAELIQPIQTLFSFAKATMQPIVLKLDALIDDLTNMIYIFLLTGETEQPSSEWFGIVAIMPMSGEMNLIAMANEITNLEVFIEQIRKQYRKKFGIRPKITETIVSTAYYMRLRRAGKKWDFIVEEYIKRNKFSMPRDKASKRYFDLHRKHAKTLRKRIERSEKILNILVK